MGSPRQEQTTDYKFFQKPSWQGLEDLQKWNPQADPTIGANFGRQKNDLERSFVAPTGSYQTPELREQQMRSGIENIGQNEAVARQADQYSQNQMELGKRGTVAGLSAPGFANTKTTQQEKGGLFNKILGAGLGVAQAFI